MTPYLPVSCRILDQAHMQFRPFGKELSGEPICDLSGVSIRANVEYLEETISRVHGEEAGKRAIEELVTRLNERIPDHAYHVTPDFLKSPWTGYSNEFVAYLVELCIDQSGDPQFQFNMGKRNLISPIIQTLMRPFSIHYIYKMASSWVQHYNQNSYQIETKIHDEHSATIRMTLTERALRHFGPYRLACGKIWCHALKIGITMIPPMVHKAPEAVVQDLRCVAYGDECCEWKVTWTTPKRKSRIRVRCEQSARWLLQQEIEEREQVIQEQLQSLELRHQELHRAYVEQQQYAMERARRVDQLTVLHETGLTFITTRDQETLLRDSLETVVKQLPYHRALIGFFDSERRLLYDCRIVGVEPEVADFVRTLEIPVTSPQSIEARVLLFGESFLIPDLHEIWEHVHPLYQELAKRIESRSIVAVPLRIKDRILGSLCIDSRDVAALTEDDLAVMKTVANQIAIALDNVQAYEEISSLNTGLEQTVKERTKELKEANEKLQELDRVKSLFLANVSHDLRTPLTSIKGLTTNLMDGILGTITESQATYLCRINANTARLTRMISDLLDLTSIAAGKLNLNWQKTDLATITQEMVEQVEFQADAKAIRLHTMYPSEPVLIVADGDRLSQVFQNLIDNAVKFTPQEGTITVEVTQDSPETVQVIVSDTGPGIPEQYAVSLFDPFFQAPQDSAHQRKGLGLGLSIVKSFVSLHGGIVRVESEPGQGTSFIVSLPVQQQPMRDPTLRT